MAKEPIMATDLEAKGWFQDGSGAFVYKRVKHGAAEARKGTLCVAEALKTISKPKPKGLIAIENVLKASRIAFATEYVFSETRLFRFDVAILDMKVGIEYEGIFSKKSRHTGIKGYTEDANKYNLAQLEGWVVLRYTAKNYKNFIDDLTTLLINRNHGI